MIRTSVAVYLCRANGTAQFFSGPYATTTLVRKWLFDAREDEEKWLFEVDFGDFSGQTLAGAYLGLKTLSANEDASTTLSQVRQST